MKCSYGLHNPEEECTNEIVLFTVTYGPYYFPSSRLCLPHLKKFYEKFVDLVKNEKMSELPKLSSNH